MWNLHVTLSLAKWIPIPSAIVSFIIEALAAMLVPKNATMKFVVFMINVSIYNHPCKKIRKEDQKVVVVLVHTCGATND